MSRWQLSVRSWSPMPFGSESDEDDAWLPWDDAQWVASPMPFGSESDEDGTGHIDGPAADAWVTNAFRQ